MDFENIWLHIATWLISQQTILMNPRHIETYFLEMSKDTVFVLEIESQGFATEPLSKLKKYFK